MVHRIDLGTDYVNFLLRNPLLQPCVGISQPYDLLSVEGAILGSYRKTSTLKNGFKLIESHPWIAFTPKNLSLQMSSQLCKRLKQANLT